MFDDLLSPEHLIVLGIVALLIFGPKRLPELGSGLGQALRGFRDAVSGVGSDPVQKVSQAQHSHKLSEGVLTPEQSSPGPVTKSDSKTSDTP